MRDNESKVLREVAEMLDRLEDCLSEMSSREAEFIESLIIQLEEDGGISERQFRWVTDINDKY